MSQSILNQTAAAETAAAEWKILGRLGGGAALIQLACVLMTIIVAFTVGVEPKTADEYFTVLQNDRLVGLLRLDFSTLILISLVPITAFGIYAALRRCHRAYAALTTALIFIGTMLALANHSAFSMTHLSDQYARRQPNYEGRNFWPRGRRSLPQICGTAPRAFWPVSSCKVVLC